MQALRQAGLSGPVASVRLLPLNCSSLADVLDSILLVCPAQKHGLNLAQREMVCWLGPLNVQAASSMRNTMMSMTRRSIEGALHMHCIMHASQSCMHMGGAPRPVDARAFSNGVRSRMCLFSSISVQPGMSLTWMLWHASQGSCIQGQPCCQTAEGPGNAGRAMHDHRGRG